MLSPTSSHTFRQILTSEVAPHQAEHREACGRFSAYTALGDSYACGYGSATRLKLCNASLEGFGSTCTTERCSQDVGAYSLRFAQSHSIDDFQYLACNGNDTGSVLSSQVKSANFGNLDLVTVNMGGDDNSFFANVITTCIFHYDSSTCDGAIESASKIIDGLPNKYQQVFAGIKAKVHAQTNVVAMSYTQFWGNLDTKDCVWPLNLPTTAQKSEMNRLARNMNRRLKDEAFKAGYLYGDVDSAFQGHRICDQTGHDSFKSWFQMFPKMGYDTGDEFYFEVSVMHPTAEGQDVMLRVLNETLRC